MSIRARQTGSAFTAWRITGGGPGAPNKILALCQEVSHRSPQPVAGAVEVHPLNYLRPTEILVPRAITHGEITMTVLETYDNNIWAILREVFPSIPDGTNDLADLFTWMMTNAAVNNENGSTITLQRVIRDPNSSTWRFKTFEKARIVDVRDDENATVDSLVNPLTLTVWYTKLTETTQTLPTNSHTAPAVDPVWS